MEEHLKRRNKWRVVLQNFAFGYEPLTEMEMHLLICLTALEVILIWKR